MNILFYTIVTLVMVTTIYLNSDFLTKITSGLYIDTPAIDKVDFKEGVATSGDVIEKQECPKDMPRRLLRIYSDEAKIDQSIYDVKAVTDVNVQVKELDNGWILDLMIEYNNNNQHVKHVKEKGRIYYSTECRMDDGSF